MTKLKLRDFVRPIGKPLSTKGGRGIYPTVYVDVSTQTCGPRLRRDLMVAIPDFPVRESCMVKVKTPYVFDPDQAALAAAQWGSDGDQPVDRPWLKSWYFPADAFDPWPRKQPAGLCCWHCTCEFDWAPFHCRDPAMLHTADGEFSREGSAGPRAPRRMPSTLVST